MAKRKTVQAAALAKASGTPPDLKAFDLSWVQERFVEAYCENGGNATDAYFKTHNCSRATARSEGCVVLAKPSVAAAVDKWRAHLLAVANYNLEKHVRVLVGVYTASRDEFTEIAKDFDNKENYRGLGDKRYAILKTKEIPTEFGTKREFELESKAWAERGLQTIFGFNKKSNTGDGSANDSTVLESCRRIIKSGKK